MKHFSQKKHYMALNRLLQSDLDSEILCRHTAFMELLRSLKTDNKLTDKESREVQTQYTESLKGLLVKSNEGRCDWRSSILINTFFITKQK